MVSGPESSTKRLKFSFRTFRTNLRKVLITRVAIGPDCFFKIHVNIFSKSGLVRKRFVNLQYCVNYLYSANLRELVRFGPLGLLTRFRTDLSVGPETLYTYKVSGPDITDESIFGPGITKPRPTSRTQKVPELHSRLRGV